MKRLGFLLMLALTALPFAGKAEDAPVSGASYEACSMVASQYLTTVQLLQQGLEPEILKETLPGLTEEGARRIDAIHDQVSNAGFLETYSGINARFARCARQVYEAQGEPQRGEREHHFYVCAGENKIRYEILLAAWAGGDREEVLQQLQPQHQVAANSIYDLYKDEGAVTVFHQLATELKQCLSTGHYRQ